MYTISWPSPSKRYKYHTTTGGEGSYPGKHEAGEIIPRLQRVFRSPRWNLLWKMATEASRLRQPPAQKHGYLLSKSLSPTLHGHDGSIPHYAESHTVRFCRYMSSLTWHGEYRQPVALAVRDGFWHIVSRRRRLRKAYATTSEMYEVRQIKALTARSSPLKSV